MTLVFLFMETHTVLFDVQSLIYAILCTVKNILTKKLRLNSAKQLHFFKRVRWWKTRSVLFIDQIWTIKSYRNLFVSCYSYVRKGNSMPWSVHFTTNHRK